MLKLFFLFDVNNYFLKFLTILSLGQCNIKQPDNLKLNQKDSAVNTSESVKADDLSDKSFYSSALNQPAGIDPSLWRGVNLQLIITNKGKSLKQEDFDYAAECGANVIRLAVFANPDNKFNTSPFFDTNGSVLDSLKNNGLADLTTAINMAKKDNLKIIIDMHSMPGFKNGEIWTNPARWDQLTKLWCFIASHYKNNSTVLAFDLMNEPNILEAISANKAGLEKQMFQGKWNAPAEWRSTTKDYTFQMTNLISAIRKIDASRYLIVEGFGMKGNPVNFNWLKPITNYNNIVYSFHMYVPTDLTMLGTQGSEKRDKAETTTSFKMPQDEAVIDKAFAPVLAFQKKYNVPIYVGEFGVTDDGIFGKSADGTPYNAACWLGTVINKMDKYKWGWTYWDFWTGIRKPDSKQDPRYLILSAAMKGQPVNNYCK